MKIDIPLWIDDLHTAAPLAKAAEDLGFDGLWTSDIAHNPLFPLVLAATQTSRIELGTAILVALARSPMDVAYQAWDLAKMSKGSFLLGLGTQVRAHIERRFGMTWRTPVDDHMREYITALRSIWHSWQSGERLNYRGDFYRFTLMTPFFNPGPINYPHIPIYMAGVNERICTLAGEISDGFHVHPFHTRRYLSQIVLPAIENGSRMASREKTDVAISSAIFVATGATPADMDEARNRVRKQVAFYASTPDYTAVMDLHDWGGIREELSKLAARNHWDEMPALIGDEMLNEFAIVCKPEQVAKMIQQKYGGLLDRVTLYLPFNRGTLALWQSLLR